MAHHLIDVDLFVTLVHHFVNHIFGTRHEKVRQTEKLVASGKVKELLQSEIREELKKRGASPVGKRWELEQRLQHLLDEGAKLLQKYHLATPSRAAPQSLKCNQSRDFT